MTKKMIHRSIDIEVAEDMYLDEMSLTTLSNRLPQLIEKYGPDVYIEKEYYGYDGGYDLYLHFDRLETDEEYADRLKKEEKERAKKQAEETRKLHNERKEYLRLKKKFG